MKSKHLLKYWKKIILISILSIVLLGCSSDPFPVGKKNFEDKITKASQNKLKLVSFEKVDGIKREMYGQQFYELEYKAVIEFVQSGWKDDGWLTGGYAVLDNQPTGWDAWNHQYKYHEKGSQMTISGKMNFAKTENGWKGE